MPYPPDATQIATIRQFLESGFNKDNRYQLHDRHDPGNMQHIFTYYDKSKPRAAVHVMRDFWDDHPTPEKICAVLLQHGLVTKIVEARGRPVAVWSWGIEIGNTPHGAGGS